jgi:hypothetical protein
MSHFEGRTVPEHLKAARQKGAMAAAEVHGTEMSGHSGAMADAGKECAVYLLILWILLHNSLTQSQTFFILLLFSVGLVLWKSGRSALLGWSRLERLHRLTEEERWEIEHHRAQEKEELKELYSMKGFEGRLLDEVVETLMADDNRLLQIMLEEELGVTLEAHEHPLKQAAGAAIGSVAVCGTLLFLLWVLPSYGILIGSFLSLIFFTALGAKLERNQALTAAIWTLATAALVAGILFFINR